MGNERFDKGATVLFGGSTFLAEKGIVFAVEELAKVPDKGSPFGIGGQFRQEGLNLAQWLESIDPLVMNVAQLVIAVALSVWFARTIRNREKLS